MDSEPFEAEQRTGQLLFLAHTFARALANQAMSPYGVELRHLGALAYAVQENAGSQRQIVEALGIDKSTMVRTLDELEARGLVQRRRSPQDRRAHRIVVTTAGRKVLREANRASGAAMAQLLAVLTPDERAEFTRLLTRFVEHSRALHADQQR